MARVRFDLGTATGPRRPGGRAHALERIESYIDIGVKDGAELVADGRGHEVARHEQGFFTGGTLFDKFTP